MGGSKAAPGTVPITDAFLLELRECLTQRCIRQGLASLQRQAALLNALDPRQENAARFAGHLAQWVDLGAFDPSALHTVIQRFDTQARAHLTLNDYLYLRMADGMAAMSEEEMEAALRHFDFVLGLEKELGDEISYAIVLFWKARCLRRRGEYEQALIFAHRGKETALRLGFPRMAALSQVLESWLLFQKGKLKEAEQVSHTAESVLRETDDHVTLGNIYSFYGRMARRAGRYDKAIEHFNQAIHQYRQRDARHPNLARSLANIALAKRAIALQLRRKIDAEAERRRKSAAPPKPASSRATDYRQRLQQLHREVLHHLDEASEIYTHHPVHHGIGTVELNYAYVLLDNGDYHDAEVRARRAYQLGEEKNDTILMGRARIVQCMIENARVEEEVGEGTDPGGHARRALEYSHEAIELAKHTQNQRLLTSAYLWLGFTQCNPFFDDSDAAREAYDLALAARKGAPPDSVWEDLQALKSKIVRSGSIDSQLRAWSQGSLGDKTFQQISEEFAQLIIPRVWEREGRKVSRVAARLSISPKKVRRILDRAGRRKPR